MFRLEAVLYKNILSIELLTLPGNKITCIVGESGSGKTTLLRLLNKMISPDSGEISYQNIPLSIIPAIELRRKVVMLQQFPVIFPGSVGDNLLVGLKFAEKPPVSSERLSEILSFVHLRKDLDSPAEKLSGGEKQRLALGRILLLEPEVMLLDEPSAGLDEETEQLVVNSLVVYTKQNQKTLLMVTHAKQVARDYAEQIIEISNGKIVSQQEVHSHAGGD
ncbi:MAG: ABC transporter ATP-binding protein [Dethiobacter sp.]|jgi:putative ABC transport system ATP-binding protein|nr:ABC transporter ATP-binding protein [Dethiobacter sp.]MBS3901532.1 ABC transporter ATP-binding protein [Dethiobacter sp.]MBS3989544.1 ABC transporter ATP-binding protein [Dethiobacter sp.]